MRTSIVVLFTVLMSLAALGGAFLVADPIECIEDRIFDFTASLNTFFATHQSAKFTFMIICGLMMDIMVLTQFYRFAMFGTTWRFLISIAIFYIFRFICQVRIRIQLVLELYFKHTYILSSIAID